MISYIDRIAEDWIITHSNDDLIASWQDPLFIIEVIIESSYSYGWSIILSIIKMDEKGDSLNDLIYGPFESWVWQYADSHIDLIEEEARDNDRFKWALGGLTKKEGSDPIWERIELARGGPWPANEVPSIPSANRL